MWLSDFAEHVLSLDSFRGHVIVIMDTPSRILFVQSPEDALLMSKSSFFGRAMLLIFLGYVFYNHMVDPEYYGLMNMVNLPIHEAGHLLFAPFGTMLNILGGTLLQVFIPLLFLSVFLLKYRDVFGASFSLWWLADNLFGVAAYMSDARSRALPLLGGDPDGHDWYNLFTMWGVLPYDTILGGSVRFIAAVCMIFAIAWNVRLLWMAGRNIFSGVDR